MDMSYLLFRRPLDALATVPGAGAEIESDDLLADGSPGNETAIRWISNDPESITDFLAIRQDWSGALPALGGYMLGLRLEDGDMPIGVPVEVRGKRAGDPDYTYALGGNSLTEVTRLMPDGSVGVCWLFDAGLDSIVGWEVKIFNDNDGDTFADADTRLRIGEMEPAEGVAACIAHGWSRKIEPGSEVERTKGQQPHEVEGVDIRVLEFARIPTLSEDEFLQGLANDLDWQRIDMLMVKVRARVMVYLRAQNDAGTFDSAELHANAVYGVCRPSQSVHVQNTKDRYTEGYRHEEVPVIV